MRQGKSVFISKQGQEIGAYALCQRLIQTAGLESEDLLLSNLVKKKEQWTRKKGSLNYTRARELLQEAVGKAGMDPTEFGLHSLRSGGTTAAAAAKVPQRLLKRQGGWHSEAVNIYIQETLDNLLAPSEAASWWSQVPGYALILCCVATLPGYLVLCEWDVGHVCACVKGSVSLGEGVVG